MGGGAQVPGCCQEKLVNPKFFFIAYADPAGCQERGPAPGALQNWGGLWKGILSTISVVSNPGPVHALCVWTFGTSVCSGQVRATGPLAGSTLQCFPKAELFPPNAGGEGDVETKSSATALWMITYLVLPFICLFKKHGYKATVCQLLCLALGI